MGLTPDEHRRVRASRHRFRSAKSSPNTHEYAVVGQCIDGAADAWIGTMYRLEPGDVVVIPESMPHYMTTDSEIELYGVSLCVGCLTGPHGDALRGVFHSVREGSSAVLRSPDRADRLASIFEHLIAEPFDSSPASELATDGLLAQLAAELLRSSTHAVTSHTPMQPLVADAIAHIEQHALGSLSLKDVAAAVARTPAHVAETMKAETGRTVGDWIADYRMAAARQLLLRSDESIDALAERVGYASASHFHRVFRARHGLAPGQWRSLHRG